MNNHSERLKLTLQSIQEKQDDNLVDKLKGYAKKGYGVATTEIAPGFTVGDAALMAVPGGAVAGLGRKAAVTAATKGAQLIKNPAVRKYTQRGISAVKNLFRGRSAARTAETAKMVAGLKGRKTGLSAATTTLRKAVTGDDKNKDELKENIYRTAKRINEEGLRAWFGNSRSKGGKPGWVQVVSGKPCARQPGQKSTPKCVSSSKRASMTPAQRRSAQARKRRADPNQRFKTGAAKPTYVPTDKPKKKAKGKKK